MKDQILNLGTSSPQLKDYIQFKSFSWLYNQLFETVEAQSDALKEKAFRIRYEVLCEEFGYHQIKPDADKMERDHYDDHARHILLIHKRSGEAIGTVRVVLPNMDDLQNSLPLQERFQGGRLKDEQLLKSTCEISKLCVLKQFRSRKGDEGSPLGCVHDQDQETFIDKTARRIARRLIPFAPIGLIRSSFEIAIKNGQTQCCVLLETPLIDSFEQLGIMCHRIGPVIDYEGRQPVLIDIFMSLHNMRIKQKAIWEVMTHNGLLHDQIMHLKTQNLLGESP